MDATRARRTRDPARQAWYARHRQWRFARFLGFLTSSGPATKQKQAPGPTISTGRREASFVTTAVEMCLSTHGEWGPGTGSDESRGKKSHGFDRHRLRSSIP
jgi:hypothetical protein